MDRSSSGDGVGAGAFGPEPPRNPLAFPPLPSLRSFLQGSLTFGVFIAGPAFGAPHVQAQVVDVDLQEVERLARDHSPEWERFETRFEVFTHREEALVRPADPTFGYELEFQGESPRGIYEHALFVEQTFRMPGLGRSLRERTESRLVGFELERTRDRTRWLADTRRGLVQWAIAERKLERLERVRSLVAELGTAVRIREEAGEVSGVERQLLALTQFQLQSRMEDLSLERDELRWEWQVRMGLDDRDLRLAEGIPSRRALLPEESDVLEWMGESPTLRAEAQAVESARRARQVEESRRWPGLDLRAGYRRVSPAWDGFLVGFSIPLPLREGNARQIQSARAEERDRILSNTMLEARESARVRQALRGAWMRAVHLQEFPEELTDPDPLLDDLIALYRDGMESLPGILSSLVLLTDGYQSYFEQLELYFEGVFQLEALTGRTLIDP